MRRVATQARHGPPRGHCMMLDAYNDVCVMYGLDPSVPPPDLALMGLPWHGPCDVSVDIWGIGLLDAEDVAVLADETAMGHVLAASDAHRRATGGAEVDWEAVIHEHILA